jgi:hypothetical protein
VWEKEKIMLKKYILIGILVITVALAISAFTWVSVSRSNGSQVGQTQGLVISDKGERDSISSISVSGFRKFPMSDHAVSSNAVTGFRTPPMSSYASIAVTGFRTPPMSNYASIALTGFRTPPMTDYAASALIPVTGIVTPFRAGSYLVVVGQYHDR